MSELVRVSTENKVRTLTFANPRRLNGWTGSAASHPLAGFFEAFAGSRQLGHLVGRYASRVVAGVCGHTHKRVYPIDVDGIPWQNVGSDHENPAHVIIEIQSAVS